VGIFVFGAAGGVGRVEAGLGAGVGVAAFVVDEGPGTGAGMVCSSMRQARKVSHRPH